MKFYFLFIILFFGLQGWPDDGQSTLPDVNSNGYAPEDKSFLGGLINPMVYKYPSSQKVELNGSSLGECLVAATVLSNHAYSLSRSKMISPYRKDQFKYYLYASSPDDEGKVKGADSYKTGFEEKLKVWILQQPDNSVDPVGLYRKALELSDGNVWNALLCIHDLLRNNARFYDTKRYTYPDSKKNVERLFNKLIDIRGDLKERGVNFKGDHSGSWYRIWIFPLFLMMDVDEKQPRYPHENDCNCKSLHTGFGDQFKQLLPIVKKDYLKVAVSIYEGGKGNNEIDAKGKVKLDRQLIEMGATMVTGLWLDPMTKERAKQIMPNCGPQKYLEKK